MPKAFDDMVEAIKDSLRKQFPKWSEKEINDRAYSIAVSRWKKSHDGKSPF